MSDTTEVSIFDGDLVAIMAAIIFSQMNLSQTANAPRLAVDHAQDILKVVRTGK